MMDLALKKSRSVTPIAIATEKLGDLLNVDTLSDEDSAKLREVHKLIAGLDQYLEAMTSPASPALTALARRTAAEPWTARFDEGVSGAALESEMLTGHVEGQFLKMLVRATGARRILEIGLFTGYSAMAMAEALPLDGELIALEIDPFAARFARENFSRSVGERIDIRVGAATDSLAALPRDAPFDLIFIDADKPGYSGYLDQVMERELLARDGLLCVDNTLLQGQPYCPETTNSADNENGRAIAEFNRKVANDPRLVQVLVPLRDGVTLIQHA